MRATFGILVSRDAGRSWQWVCERALGYAGTWDPPVAVTRDGRLWVGLERGLVSTLDGCTVDTSPELAGETVKDLTTDLAGETIWALTGAPDRRGAIWRRSRAEGAPARWERVGQLPEGLNPMTLEVAPSSPSRLYVTAQPWETVRGWLLRSDDGGKTITAGVGGKNDLAGDGPFFVAAVDPKDPDRALVRHLHSSGSDVLLTTDGGKTLRNVLSMKSAMFGFAKSPDGSVYYAGSGLADHGIYRSSDRGEHFERVASHGVLCLHAAPGGRLFVCENTMSASAKVVALSTDEGKTIAPIAGFPDILGPARCSAAQGRAADRPAQAGDGGARLCDDAWPELQAQLAPRSDDGGAGTDGGKRRRPRDGGADGGSEPAASTERARCGCRAAGAAGRRDRAWLTTGLLPLIAWARPRARTGSRRLRTGRARTRGCWNQTAFVHAARSIVRAATGIFR